MSNADEEFVVEKILNRRLKKGVIQYYIKWKDFPSDDNTWEPASNLNCDSMIEEFEESLREEKEKEKEKEKQKEKQKERKREESLKSKSKNRSARYAESGSDTDEDWIVDNDRSTPARSSKKRQSSVKNKSSVMVDSDSETENVRPPLAKRLCGFDRGFEPEKIIGATDIGGDLKFLVKWKDHPDTELIPASLANERIPQAVISFYEDRLTWQTTTDKK